LGWFIKRNIGDDFDADVGQMKRAQPTATVLTNGIRILVRGKQIEAKGKYMSKAKTTDPLDRKFTLESVRNQGEKTDGKNSKAAKGVRGKYFSQVSAGTNMVKFEPEIAKVFTNAKAVNAALASVIEIGKLTNLRRTQKRKTA
jgi:hypothetical protein